MIEDRGFWKDALAYQPRGNFQPHVQLRLLVGLICHLQKGQQSPLFKSSASSASLNASHEPFATTPKRAESLSRKGAGSPIKLKGGPLRNLQHVYTFLQPLDRLRYTVPAASFGAMGSVVVDRSGHVATFGSMPSVAPIPGRHFIATAAGGGFAAFITQDNEIIAVGGGEGTVDLPPVQKGPAVPRLLARDKMSMVAARDDKLVALSTTRVVRPLTTIATNAKYVFPSREVRWVCLGGGDACYMVGADSVLYKTTMSSRNVSTPRRVMTMVRVCVSTVASGSGFFAVIDASGRLWTGGKNAKGQLGNGKREENNRVPHLHRSHERHFFTMVVCGNEHLLALSADGLVFGTGSNNAGQLGLGPNVGDVLQLTQIPLQQQRCVAIAAGPVASCFALGNGSVLVCGSNDCGMLGQPQLKRFIYAPTVLPGVSGISTYVLDSASGTPRTAEEPARSMPPPKPEPAKAVCSCCAAM